MTYKEQAKKICSTLSLKEKVGQLTYLIPGFHAYEKVDGEITFTDELKVLAKEYGVGIVSAYLRGDPWTKKGYGAGIEIQERVNATRVFQEFIMENGNHSIPAIIDIEASHGMQALGSVMYPVGLCSAAAWNPKLYGRMMTRIGEEIKASGNHIALVTMIDLARDPPGRRCLSGILLYIRRCEGNEVDGRSCLCETFLRLRRRRRWSQYRADYFLRTRDKRSFIATGQGCCGRRL